MAEKLGYSVRLGCQDAHHSMNEAKLLHGVELAKSSRHADKANWWDDSDRRSV